MTPFLLKEVAGYVVCANLNSYDQTIVSGETPAVIAVVELATKKGLRAHMLDLNRAFHSKLLKACAGPLRTCLETLILRTAAIPVPANVSRQMYPFASDVRNSGRPMSDSQRVHTLDLLCRQVDHPVDFVSQIEFAYESGARRFIEIGPRNVLTRLVEDMLQGKPFQAISVDEPTVDVRNTLESLQDMLTRPLTIQRKPLPAQPAVIRCRPSAATSAGPMSPADLVRSVVAQVSGYDISQINDNDEFERDFGIDTLKIFSIISQLRGKVLPNKFANFRQATSVSKILACANAETPETESLFMPSTRKSLQIYSCETHFEDSPGRSTVVPPDRRFRVVTGLE